MTVARPNWSLVVALVIAARVSAAETDGERLARECGNNIPLSCSVLAGAYQEGGIPNAPEIGRDLAAAQRYRIKACKLGSAFDCAIAGSAFAEGKGVEKDATKAMQYLKLACDDPSASGYDCGQLAKVLLDSDFFGNYDAAMSAFKRGCQRRQIVCKQLEFYEGTGRVPASTPPTGALGYKFGLKSREVAKICATQGGKYDAKKNAADAICRSVDVAALKERAMYLAFDFCGGDSLCGISVALRTTPADFYKKYSTLRDRLFQIYEMPSKIEVKTTSDCRTTEAIAGCIEAGTARFATFWMWNKSGMVDVALVSGGGDVAVTLGYFSPERIKQEEASGL